MEQKPTNSISIRRDICGSTDHSRGYGPPWEREKNKETFGWWSSRGSTHGVNTVKNRKEQRAGRR
jgi:hypothetical protein